MNSSSCKNIPIQEDDNSNEKLHNLNFPTITKLKRVSSKNINYNRKNLYNYCSRKGKDNSNISSLNYLNRKNANLPSILNQYEMPVN